MTQDPTTLAETILRDVRPAIHKAILDPGETEGYKGDRTLTAWQTDAVMRAVLAALTAALDGVDERAGEVLERLRWHREHPVTGKLVYANEDGPAAADLITALLAQNAALRAERDDLCPKCEVKGDDCGEHTPSWEELAAYWKSRAEVECNALRAERDAYRESHLHADKRLLHEKTRADAAEAVAKKLRAERDEALTFLDNAISKAPEPLKALGKYLAGRLDEDEWPTAEQHLNAAAKACAALTTEEGHE